MDRELVAALTAIVNQENILMDGENRMREIRGESPAYTCTSGLSEVAERLKAAIR